MHRWQVKRDSAGDAPETAVTLWHQNMAEYTEETKDKPALHLFSRKV